MFCARVLAPACALLLLAACGSEAAPSEAPGSGGTGGGSASAVGGGCAATGGGGVPPGIATPCSDPAAGCPPMADPSTLQIVVGSIAFTCASTACIGACPSWVAEVYLPPALQKPGTIQLTQVDAEITVGGMRGGGVCSMDSLPLSGTLDILSIDAHLVRMRWTDVSVGNFTPEGEHDAVICP